MLFHIEALRNEEYTGAVFSGVPERAQVSRHRADIMRDEHPLVFRCQRQDLGIAHAA